MKIAGANITSKTLLTNFIQQGSPNCGMHVSDYIRLRSSRNSDEEIFETQKDTLDVNNIRKEIVEGIVCY